MNPSTGAPRQRLNVWIVSQTDFPEVSGPSYPERLKNVATYLRDEIHKHVEKGPLLRNEGFLTGHGSEHVEAIIERAGDLLADPVDTYPQLTAYEVYLLLMAIQFHDVGNVYGREGHEERISEVMDQIGTLLGDEMVEKVAIKRIARAHGGFVNGNRDTIAALPTEDWILNCRVRYQALAAILRFADELSDDYRRAARTLTALEVIPQESRIFHMYAESLHSVIVEPKAHVVKLRYYVTNDSAAPIRRYGESLYLLDEIYRRTVKMHYEREYCMRFIRGLVQIDAIDVQIDVYHDNRRLEPSVDPIVYRLQQVGYPGNRDERITDLISTDWVLPTGCQLYSKLAKIGGAI